MSGTEGVFLLHKKIIICITAQSELHLVAPTIEVEIYKRLSKVCLVLYIPLTTKLPVIPNPVLLPRLLHMNSAAKLGQVKENKKVVRSTSDKILDRKHYFLS